MAQLIYPIAASSKYRGLESIFEYTNQDGALTRWNCGQAAAATFLTHHGVMDPLHAGDNMRTLERDHPPDQLGGWFGTGRRRVERIMRAFQIPIGDIVGLDGIRHELERRNPVMLMLGKSQGRLLGFNIPGGHWMVAYGCDERAVYLTNDNPMTWDEIAASWRSIAGWWIHMNGRGLARVKT